MISKVYWNKDGKSSEIRDEKMLCAFEVFDDELETNKFFVKCYGGQLYDPRAIDARYDSRNHWKMLRVQKDVYELYIRFLVNKRRTLLLNAERLL